MMIPTLTLALLAAPHVSGDAPVARPPEKIQVEAPLRMRDDATIKAIELDGSRTTKPLASIRETSDKIEQVKRSELTLWSRCDWLFQIREDLSTVKARDLRRWTFECATDASGSCTIQASLVIDSNENVFRVAAQRAATDFSIVYSVDGRVSALPCSAWIVREPDDYSAFNRTVRATMKPEDLLGIADAGAFRVKYPEGPMDFDLSEPEKESLRWFVQEKVPGGSKLVADRYVLVPRPAPASKSPKASKP